MTDGGADEANVIDAALQHHADTAATDGERSPAFSCRVDLNKDGKVTVADVKKLTRARAEKIFKEHYFNRPKIHMLPDSIQASVFDMYVNAGGNAVKILQRLLREFGETSS